MSNVLVIGANGEVARSLKTTPPRAALRLELITQTWKTVRRKQDTLAGANVLLLDMTDPDAPGPRSIRSLQRRQQERPVLIAESDVTRLVGLAHLLEEPTVDFTRAADAAEIFYRLNRLLQQGRKRSLQQHIINPLLEPKPPKRQAETSSLKPLVAALRHDETGRLDARYIADFFGISLADIARVLGVSLSRLHKTPAAPSAQNSLAVFERIAFGLLFLAGSTANTRLWLNAPDPQLNNRTPLALIVEGRGHVVAEMLDDMLLGQPS